MVEGHHIDTLCEILHGRPVMRRANFEFCGGFCCALGGRLGQDDRLLVKPYRRKDLARIMGMILAEEVRPLTPMLARPQ